MVIYGRSIDYCPWIEQLRLSENVIMHAKSVKFLGAVLDEGLSFKNPVHHNSAKITRSIDMIRELEHIFPSNILGSLCFSLEHTYLV